MHRPHLRPVAPDSAAFRSRRGFTIIEVALAAFVLALGIVSAIVALQAGYKFIDVARDSTLASQILQSEIERIRLLSWAKVCALPAVQDNVDLGSMYLDDDDRSPAAIALAAKFTSRFKVKREVKPDEARPTSVRIITVSVRWTSYFERPYERKFVATYVQNGLYDYYYSTAGP